MLLRAVARVARGLDRLCRSILRRCNIAAANPLVGARVANPLVGGRVPNPLVGARVANPVVGGRVPNPLEDRFQDARFQERDEAYLASRQQDEGV
ncbi:hypothetical protein M885DRAFT_336272 [Pelagophyceae sp. CCMP2097]|nr:hypothetical protein M885DRAFT_336272 [Pelagophyceae sp. CCMP2097]